MPRVPTVLSKTTLRLPWVSHSHCRYRPHLLPLVPLTSTRLSTSSSGADSDSAKKPSQDSLPGWGGRHPRDHAVNRPALDPQAEGSKQGMKDHEAMKEGSDAISPKDERNSNKRAKEEHPEAPEPVIGMNEERGSVSGF